MAVSCDGGGGRLAELLSYCPKVLSPLQGYLPKWNLTEVVTMGCQRAQLFLMSAKGICSCIHVTRLAVQNS